ncbi:MAG TPA: polysaccharide deacetylase family protein [Burkholderiales bacterium]|jgi:peptidoglycan/xylan/chitin deacetylase (PgdA/CDA1 family)|nr:polysaccharide deacetylase family protein [Burkholderiales bacterium]
MPEPRERIDYSSPFLRPPLKLPGGARMIVWPVVNIEEWSIQRAMPRHVSPPPGGNTGAIPDVPNWAWHEYGMRVGIWRLLETFERLRIKPTVSINAKVCETAPVVARALADAGWEFMAHCYEQMSIHAVKDQPAMIKQSLDVLESFLGKRPNGWLGPGRTQTFDTLDYVKAAGCTWFGDWILDDQPLWVKTAHGPLVSLPYSVELNDITVMVSGQHESDVLQKRAFDAFDTLYAESEKSVRVMAIGFHPYITGAAHRIKYLAPVFEYFARHPGVVFWNGQQICDWFVGQQPQPV